MFTCWLGFRPRGKPKDALTCQPCPLAVAAGCWHTCGRAAASWPHPRSSNRPRRGTRRRGTASRRSRRTRRHEPVAAALERVRAQRDDRDPRRLGSLREPPCGIRALHVRKLRSIRMTSGRCSAASAMPAAPLAARAFGTRPPAARPGRALFFSLSSTIRTSGRSVSVDPPPARLETETSSPYPLLCRSGSCSRMTTTSSARASGACWRRGRPRGRGSVRRPRLAACRRRRRAAGCRRDRHRMPPSDTDEGIQAADALRATNPEVGVVVLSQYANPSYLLALLEGGSARRAYLLKERVNNLDQLVGRDPRSRRGRLGDRPKVVEALVAENARAEESPLNQLTPRERDVLRDGRGRTTRRSPRRSS